MNRRLIAVALATLMLVAAAPAQLPNYTGAVTWQGNSTYTIGAYVLYQGVLYQALQQNTNVSPTAGAPNWAQILGYNALAINGIPVSTTTPTNGQTLVYNSTTGQYAPGSGGGGSGGMTLIQDQTLVSAAASVTFSAIPQTYKHLVLMFVTAASSNADDNLQVVINGDVGADYTWNLTYVQGDTVIAAGASAADAGVISPFPVTTALASGTITVYDYVPTILGSKTLTCVCQSSGNGPSSTNVVWANSAAITSLTFQSSLGTNNLIAGSRFTLYGIN